MTNERQATFEPVRVDLYVVLDATIGLNKQTADDEQTDADVVETVKEVQFRINVNDLALLRGLGIDPTRKVRSARRVEPLAQTSDATDQ